MKIDYLYWLVFMVFVGVPAYFTEEPLMWLLFNTVIWVVVDLTSRSVKSKKWLSR